MSGNEDDSTKDASDSVRARLAIEASESPRSLVTQEASESNRGLLVMEASDVFLVGCVFCAAVSFLGAGELSPLLGGVWKGETLRSLSSAFVSGAAAARLPSGFASD